MSKKNVFEGHTHTFFPKGSKIKELWDLYVGRFKSMGILDHWVTGQTRYWVAPSIQIEVLDIIVAML
jgi:hypothetical protein